MKRIIIIGLLAGYLWTDASLADENFDADGWERHADIMGALAACACSNAIVAGQMDNAIMKEALTDMATWYANHTRKYATDNGFPEEFANQYLTNTMKSIQSLYNTGHRSWEDIVNHAESCAQARLNQEE